jgi:osmotically inducible protein OsmC
MANFSRHVTVDWQGTLMEGSGQATAGTGAFTLPVSFPRRIGEPEGTTSPEELIAGAHAACYAMVVAGALTRANASTTRTRVTCTVTAEKTDAGLRILTSRLEVVAKGLKGMDAATFKTTAQEANAKCPVSNALLGGLQIEVDARVE